MSSNGIAYMVLFIDRFSRHADMCDISGPDFTAEGVQIF